MTDPDRAAIKRRANRLEIAAREYIWLWDSRHGTSTRRIAELEGISEADVEAGLANARARETVPLEQSRTA